MSIASRNRSGKQDNPTTRPLVPGPDRHLIPVKMSGIFMLVTPKGGHGVGRVARKARRGPFFKPTHEVYGYENESDYLKHHHDVVNKQRFERGSERNQSFKPSRAAELFR